MSASSKESIAKTREKAKLIHGNRRGAEKFPILRSNSEQ